MKKPMRWRGFLGGLMLVAAACAKPHDDPTAAYGAFSSSMKKHEWDQAYKALSTPTQKLIEERARSIAEAGCPPGEQLDAGARCAVKPDAPVLFFASGVKVQELGKMTVLERNDATAVIEVAEDGGSYRQKMVKEGNAWRVDLSEGLK
jgi:hypothetical protein